MLSLSVEHRESRHILGSYCIGYVLSFDSGFTLSNDSDRLGKSNLVL